MINIYNKGNAIMLFIFQFTSLLEDDIIVYLYIVNLST